MNKVVTFEEAKELGTQEMQSVNDQLSYENPKLQKKSQQILKGISAGIMIRLDAGDEVLIKDGERVIRLADPDTDGSRLKPIIDGVMSRLQHGHVLKLHSQHSVYRIPAAVLERAGMDNTGFKVEGLGEEATIKPSEQASQQDQLVLDTENTRKVIQITGPDTDKVITITIP
jgi:hypothetical protein